MTVALARVSMQHIRGGERERVGEACEVNVIGRCGRVKRSYHEREKERERGGGEKEGERGMK